MQESYIKIKLGEKIKKYRDELNITQEYFAEKIDISQRQVSLIENGKSFPRVETIEKILKVFGCTIKDLFNFEPDKDIKDLIVKIKSYLDKADKKDIEFLYKTIENIEQYKFNQ